MPWEDMESIIIKKGILISLFNYIMMNFQLEKSYGGNLVQIMRFVCKTLAYYILKKKNMN